MSAADETARLLHMEQIESGVRDIPAFNAALKAHHPELSLPERMTLWRKYRGIDGASAIHDPFTGGRS